MPVKEYEKLLYEQPYFEDDETRRTSNDTNAIWTANMQMEMIFSNMMQAAAIYEYSDGNIEVVRVMTLILTCLVIMTQTVCIRRLRDPLITLTEKGLWILLHRLWRIKVLGM